MHKLLVYNSQHKRHPLIASRAKRTRYCGVGSTSKRCVSMQLFCRTGQKRDNRVVGEWSGKAVERMGGAWGPLAGAGLVMRSRGVGGRGVQAELVAEQEGTGARRRLFENTGENN